MFVFDENSVQSVLCKLLLLLICKNFKLYYIVNIF